MNARKKRGRPPSIWHGPIGSEFLRAVGDAQYHVLPSGLLRRRKTRAAAIRSVLRQTEFAFLREMRTVRPAIWRRCIWIAPSSGESFPPTEKLSARACRFTGTQNELVERVLSLPPFPYFFVALFGLGSPYRRTGGRREYPFYRSFGY
jgi:hypothetical protein